MRKGKSRAFGTLRAADLNRESSGNDPRSSEKTVGFPLNFTSWPLSFGGVCFLFRGACVLSPGGSNFFLAISTSAWVGLVRGAFGT